MIKKRLKKSLINRKICICKNKLKHKINFGSLPLINNYRVSKNLRKYPVVISQCENCSLIQLKYSIKDKFLFPKNYSYLSGNSKEKINNFKSIVSKIKKLTKKRNVKILDIGSNDGSFLELAKNTFYKVVGVEPTNTAKISQKKGIDTFNKSLNLNLAKKIVQKYSKFDFVVATNFFAQTNKLDEIIESIKLILRQNGTLIIEVQYLYDLLLQKGFDSFHHEHIAYYTTSSLNKILKKYKIYIFDGERLNVHGGVLRIYASLYKKPTSLRLKKLLKKENDKNLIYKIKNLNSFRIKFVNNLKKLLFRIKRKKMNIYGIGAAPRACVMLNACNLTRREIGLVGEVKNSLKCDKYVPGTDIMVKNENRIILDKPDYVIILAWHLKKMIISLLSKKGYKGNFIIPLPNLKIIKNK